jgi:hypothetical protein
VGLLPKPQRVEPRLEGAPIDDLGRSKFISFRSCELCHRVSPSCCSIDGTTPVAARLSTRDKIEVSEWLAPDGLSIDLAAQQVSKADVRFGSKADIEACLSDVRFTSNSGHQNWLGCQAADWCEFNGSFLIFPPARRASGTTLNGLRLAFGVVAPHTPCPLAPRVGVTAAN